MEASGQTKGMNMRRISLAFVTTVLLFVSGTAFAQVDCSRLVDDLRARCEEVNRMNEACAGRTGDARKSCERENLKVPIKEDCSRVPAAAKSMCEAHNRAAEKAERCNGKMGAELDICKRQNALNKPLR
jgi:hypothetical protein